MVVKWDSFFLFGKRFSGIHSSVERYWTPNLSIFYTHSNGQKLRWGLHKYFKGFDW